MGFRLNQNVIRSLKLFHDGVMLKCAVTLGTTQGEGLPLPPIFCKNKNKLNKKYLTKVTE